MKNGTLSLQDVKLILSSKYKYVLVVATYVTIQIHSRRMPNKFSLNWMSMRATNQRITPNSSEHSFNLHMRMFRCMRPSAWCNPVVSQMPFPSVNNFIPLFSHISFSWFWFLLSATNRHTHAHAYTLHTCTLFPVFDLVHNTNEIEEQAVETLKTSKDTNEVSERDTKKCREEKRMSEL